MNRRTFMKLTPALVAGTKAACMASAAPVAVKAAQTIEAIPMNFADAFAEAWAIAIQEADGRMTKHHFDPLHLSRLRPGIKHHLCSVPEGSRVWVETVRSRDVDTSISVGNAELTHPESKT